MTARSVSVFPHLMMKAKLRARHMRRKGCDFSWLHPQKYLL
ncbi:hypothetical protein DT23_17580 [Thioclava indica]|uniref:Uncharacterized protein n=1 Tax=Thioclava indica TaxID=1353528 RepID=A0A074JGN1_9RHOB|nr:hypothetical protein DT23_17580 [Thioclava indica]